MRGNLKLEKLAAFLENSYVLNSSPLSPPMVFRIVQQVLFSRWSDNGEPSILPMKSSPSPEKWRWQPQHAFFTKRYTRAMVAGLATVSFLLLFYKFESLGTEQMDLIPGVQESDLPPLYEQYNEYERLLPQHDMSLPSPEGKHAKFLFFANHAHSQCRL